MSFLISDLAFLDCSLTSFWRTMQLSCHIEIVFIVLQIYFSKACLEIKVSHFRNSF